jgi:hypothetical protein
MQEWGVKGFLMPAAPSEAAAPVPVSGTDYLARRREARDAAEEGQQAVDAVIAAIHEELGERAAGAVLSRPHDRQLSAHDGEMVLNASYLIAESQVDDFHALVESLGRRHRDEGIELEITGPWPAYHFVESA